MSAAKTSLAERLIGRIGRGVGKGIEHGQAASHALIEMNRRLESRLLDKLEADQAIWCRTGSEVRRLAVEHRSVEGLILEFGVFKGTSIREIAGAVSQEVHGFDSFEGLPEGEGVWASYVDDGRFDLGGKPPAVPENVRLHKGWFEDTVPAFAAEHEGPISLVHFDADIYSSTKLVLDVLGDRFVPGTVVVFDEYFNYPGWQFEEYRAWQEFTLRRGISCTHLAFGTQTGTFSGYGKLALRVDATEG